MIFPFFGFSFGGIFGLIFPILFIFLGIRLIRHIFFGAARRMESDFDREPRRQVPFDDIIPDTHYHAHESPDVSIEAKIFRLADEMKGRLTVSDVVIGTNLGLKEAEEIIDSMVDGAHVTMEVRDNGRVVYEFPEIIARYEDEDDREGSSAR